MSLFFANFYAARYPKEDQLKTQQAVQSRQIHFDKHQFQDTPQYPCRTLLDLSPLSAPDNKQLGVVADSFSAFLGLLHESDESYHCYWRNLEPGEPENPGVLTF